MLTLLRPEDYTFQNKKCGEIFLMSPPALFNVSCCACQSKIQLEAFAKHFQSEHMDKENNLKEKQNKILSEQILVKDESLFEERDIGSPKAVSVDNKKVNSDEDLDDNICIQDLLVEAKNKRKGKKKVQEPKRTRRSVRNSKHTVSVLSKDVQEEDPIIDDSSTQICINIDNEKNLNAIEKTEDPLKPKEGEDKILIEKVEVTESPIPIYKEEKEDSFLNKFEIENLKEDKHSSHDSDDDLEHFQGSDAESDWFPKGIDSKAKETQPKEELPFTCPICQRSYRTKHSLQKHNYSVHNPNKPPRKKKDRPQHKCEICNEIFRSAPVLRAHKWKHTGIFCDICGLTFTKVGHLVQHKIRHTGIKNFKCKECSKDFYTSKELKSHMVCHTQIMAAICEICGKGCRNKAVLKEHMRRHTGERPAKCGVCGKCFFSGHDLNEHAVSHTSARPFKCDICESTFQRKKALRVHKRIHSNDRRHPCKICGKAFYQSTSLNTHMRTHDAAVERTPPVLQKTQESNVEIIVNNGPENLANIVVLGLETGDLFGGSSTKI